MNFSDLTPIAKYLLGLALSAFPPGRSDISTVELPECGRDPLVPTCSVEPLCGDPSNAACTAPRYEACYHGYRNNRPGEACSTTTGGAWVRNETREEGAIRYLPLVQAMADSAEHYGSAWPNGPTDLGRMMLAAGGQSTGLKEGIQVGRLRGPAGELCVMDIQPKTLRGAVPWDLSRLPAADLASLVLGTGYDANRRCFDAGALLIVRARREADRRCKGHIPEFSTFALYATGNSCVTIGTKERPDWLATPRFDSLRKFRATKATVFPDWWSRMGAT